MDQHLVVKELPCKVDKTSEISVDRYHVPQSAGTAFWCGDFVFAIYNQKWFLGKILKLSVENDNDLLVT